MPIKAIIAVSFVIWERISGQQKKWERKGAVTIGDNGFHQPVRSLPKKVASKTR